MSTEDDEFQRVVMEGLVPKVAGSSVCVSIVPRGESEVDAKFCTELGVMIMLDKPILAIVNQGAPVPPKLALVADEVFHVDMGDPAGQAQLAEKVQEFARRYE